MKFLVVTKRRATPLPVNTMEPARKWIGDKLADRTMDCCYGLVNGGGVSITNANSHEQLMTILMEYPAARFVEFEITPLCDINALFTEAETLAAHASLV